MGASQAKQLLEAQEEEDEFTICDIKIPKKEAGDQITILAKARPNLVSLEVTRCRLKVIPPELFRLLPQLRAVKLTNNCISVLPVSIPLQTTLRELDLHGNKFTEFPAKQFINFRHLEELNLSENEISSLPSPLTDLFEHLYVLKLSSNNFSTFPVSVKDLYTLTVLNLSFNKIKVLPDELAECVNLEELSLQHNSISSFPLVLTKLDSLRHLNLAQNKLESLPAEIKEMSNLCILELQHNLLSVLPAEIGELSGLTTLKLNDNQLSVLPSTIGSLQKLMELHLQENKIQVLPEKIGSLKSLRKLFLEFNELSILPCTFLQLEKLLVLMLHNNKLERVPPELFKMAHILRLSLYNNPLRNERPSIVNDIKQGGTITVMTSLAAYVDEGRSTSPHLTPRGKSTRNPLASVTVSRATGEKMGRARGNTVAEGPPSKDVGGRRGSLFEFRGGMPVGLPAKNSPKKGPLTALFADQPAVTKTSSQPPLVGGTTALPGGGGGEGSPAFAPLNDNLLSVKRSAGGRVRSGSFSRRDMDKAFEGNSNPNAKTLTRNVSIIPNDLKNVPAYNKFKDAYTAVMDQQDFSEQRKEHLKKLSVQEKWKFLSQYKGSTVEMLRQETKKSTKTTKKPEEFCQSLLSRTPARSELLALLRAMGENSDSWSATFVDAGGLTSLINISNNIRNEVPRRHRSVRLFKVVLRILHTLCHLCPKWLITTTNAVFSIVSWMGVEELDIDTKELVYELVDLICVVRFVGPGLVMESLTELANDDGSGRMRGSSIGGKSSASSITPAKRGSGTGRSPHERFRQLVDPLREGKAGPNSETSDKIKLNSMRMINALMDTCTDLDERFELRLNFISLGINSLLPSLPAMCSEERAVYEDDTAEDYQDLLTKYSYDRINELVSNAHRLEHGTVGGEDGSKQEEVQLLNLQIRSPVHNSQDLTLAYQAGKSWEEYRDMACEKAGIVNREGYGIYLSDKTTKGKNLIRQKSSALDAVGGDVTKLKEIGLATVPSLEDVLAVNQLIELRPIPVTVIVKKCTVERGEKSDGKEKQGEGNVRYEKGVDLEMDPLWPGEKLFTLIAGCLRITQTEMEDGALYVTAKDVDPPAVDLDGNNATKGRWLGDTITLMEVLEGLSQHVSSSISSLSWSVMFCTERVNLMVLLPNGTTKQVTSVDNNMTVGTLITHLIEGYGQKLDGYGLLLRNSKTGAGSSILSNSDGKGKKKTRTSSRSTWLNDSDPLKAYDISEDSIASLAPRPMEITVVIEGSPQAVNLVMDSAKSPIEALNTLQRSRHIEDASNFSLEVQFQNLASSAPIDPNRPLRPQLSPLQRKHLKQMRFIVMPKKAKEGELPVPQTLANSLQQNEPMWPETEDVEGRNITHNKEGDGEIESATFTKIIQVLTSKRAIEQEFQNIFLFTYRYFTNDAEVLEKLSERFHVPASVPEDHAQFIRMRVVVFLNNWFLKETFPPHITDRLKVFVTDIIGKTPGLQDMSDSLLQKLLDPKKSVKVDRHFGNAPKPKIPKVMSDQLTFFDLSPTEVARQLTLQVFDLYRRLDKTEFFHQNWSSESRRHNAPNLMKIIEYFNFVSSMVAGSIVRQKRVRERAKLFTKFILVAQHLRELNNYHLLVAVISGLNHCSVSRLKFTRQRLPKSNVELLTELEAMMNMEGSYKVYRTALKQSDLPAIPYIGVYLGDLTFIEDGNSDTLDGNRINFAKFRYLYNVLRSFERYQEVEYMLEEVPSIKTFIRAQFKKEHSDDDLFKASLEREPRGAARADIA